MKKYFIIIMILFTLTACQRATGPGTGKKNSDLDVTKGKKIAGIISKDTTLSGVVRVVGDIYVPEGVTLTILPGTELVIKMSESTKVEPLFISSGTEILVRGNIIAKGTAENKIVFRSMEAKPGMKSYAGVILIGSDIAEFEHCVFKNAENAIRAIDANLNVDSCEFENCFYALTTKGAKVNIKNSRVISCDKGFYFHKATTGSVTGSEFNSCFEDGVFIDKTSKVTVENNSFKSNLWGISTIEAKSKFLNSNNFMDNKEDVKGLNY